MYGYDPVMVFHDSSNDPEAQPRAHVSLRCKERLEDPWQVRWGDSDASIVESDLDLRSPIHLDQFAIYAHSSAMWHGVNSVRYEIAHQLP
jgi:hypothetical protein